jgi:hypothetical protein
MLESGQLLNIISSGEYSKMESPQYNELYQKDIIHEE